MATRPTPPRSAELVDEASNWAVGGGIVTLALFPLALPGVILLAIGVLPLLLLAIAAGLLAAIVALPVLLVVRLARFVRMLRPRRDPGSSGRPRSGGRPDRGHSSGSRSHAASGA